MAVVWWVDVIEQITVARAIHFGTATFEPGINNVIYFRISKQGTNRTWVISGELTKPKKKHENGLMY